MSRIRGKDTSIEVVVRGALHRKGYRFRKHVKDLPGRPDVVMVARKTVVFLDGDFWHGRNFPRWRKKMKPFWRKKIEATRRRDQRNFRKLRRDGWKVVRIWESHILKDLDAVLEKIVRVAERPFPGGR